jgi:hypothetical protein
LVSNGDYTVMLKGAIGGSLVGVVLAKGAAAAIAVGGNGALGKAVEAIGDTASITFGGNGSANVSIIVEAMGNPASITLGGSGSADISQPSIMTPITYSATGVELSLTGVGFQPDLVWIKDRQSTSFSHHLTDSTRGVTKGISSNSTATEVTNPQRLKSFDADGFTVGTDAEVNSNIYAAWCFKKDPEAFDIVSYTGTGVVRTVAHNMSVAPELMLIKNLDSARNWSVYHTGLNGGTTPEDFYIALNLAQQEYNNLLQWNDTPPTSSVFTVGTDNEVNENTDSHIAYLFASKAGVSKVGSYSGTGVNPNAITGLGFTPKFVLIKNRSQATDWQIYDTARGDNNALEPNESDAETTNPLVSLDSDGFTLNSTDAKVNTSGTNNYIYLALA